MRWPRACRDAGADTGSSRVGAPDDGAPVLAAVLRRPHLAAQLVHHQLHAVADAQDRDAVF